MRKKIGYLIAAGAAVALLQLAVPSAESAVTKVEEEAVQTCPATKSCPDESAKSSSCPATSAKV